MESELADFERKRGIKSRWKVTDPEYSDARQCFLKEKHAGSIAVMFMDFSHKTALSAKNESQICRLVNKEIEFKMHKFTANTSF